MTPDKKLGFFRRRDRAVADVAAVLSAPVLSVIVVNHSSIRHALRAGAWRKLGRYPIVSGPIPPRRLVARSVGTCRATVLAGDGQEWKTDVHDPAIQDMERAVVRDALYHVPGRLTADFGAEPGEWHVGSSIRRERQIMEERATRFPDRPEHALPGDWVSVERD